MGNHCGCSSRSIQSPVSHNVGNTISPRKLRFRSPPTTLYSNPNLATHLIAELLLRESFLSFNNECTCLVVICHRPSQEDFTAHSASHALSGPQMHSADLFPRVGAGTPEFRVVAHESRACVTLTPQLGQSKLRDFYKTIHGGFPAHSPPTV